MKKTIFCSLIVSLFAITSPIAYANYSPMYYQPFNFNIDGFWMEANSYYDFTLDAYPFDEYNIHSGQYTRICWRLGLYNGLLSGDYIAIGTDINGSVGNFVAYVGTNATCNAMIPVNPDGTFTVRIFTGPQSGFRSCGQILYWPTEWEIEPFYWNIEE